jgi:hypothetical protein
MGFGLAIGFIGLLQIVTTIYYSAITNSHTLQFTTACTKSSHSTVSYRLSGNGFQHCSFLTFCVQRLLSSLAGGYLTSLLGIPGHSLLMRAFPHTFTAHELYSPAAVSRLLTLVTTLYKSLSHTDQCSQSWSSLLCCVVSSNSGCPSASGLTSSQAGGCLKTNFSCHVDPHDAATGQTQRITPLPTVLLLLHDVTAVAERCLFCHCLDTGEIFDVVA